MLPAGLEHSQRDMAFLLARILGEVEFEGNVLSMPSNRLLGTFLLRQETMTSVQQAISIAGNALSVLTKCFRCHSGKAVHSKGTIPLS